MRWKDPKTWILGSAKSLKHGVYLEDHMSQPIRLHTKHALWGMTGTLRTSNSVIWPSCPMREDLRGILCKSKWFQSSPNFENQRFNIVLYKTIQRFVALLLGMFHFFWLCGFSLSHLLDQLWGHRALCYWEPMPTYQASCDSFTVWLLQVLVDLYGLFSCKQGLHVKKLQLCNGIGMILTAFRSSYSNI